MNLVDDVGYYDEESSRQANEGNIVYPSKGRNALAHLVVIIPMIADGLVASVLLSISFQLLLSSDYPSR